MFTLRGFKRLESSVSTGSLNNRTVLFLSVLWVGYSIEISLLLQPDGLSICAWSIPRFWPKSGSNTSYGIEEVLAGCPRN